MLLGVPPPAGASPTGGSPAASWIVADADTGAVIEEGNARTPLPPASLTKVFTALTVVRALPDSATVAVSARAADVPFGWTMQAGEQWRVSDALHALLLASANDAAMALAEGASGSAEAFGGALEATAAALGARDRPVLRDPAGLDGHYGVGGGNLVSAADLAIAARALIAEPRLAPVVGLRERTFGGPGGVPQRLVNHNKLLASYAGAVGMKTGYTRRAGHCLIAVAHRDGRTLIAVVMGAPRVYETAAALLDRGFAAGTPPPVDQLPPQAWPLAALPPAPAPAPVPAPPPGDGGPRVPALPQLPVPVSPSPGAHPAAAALPAPALPAPALRAALAVLVLAGMAVAVTRARRAVSQPEPPGLHGQPLA